MASTPTAEKRRRRRTEITAIQEAASSDGSLIQDFETEGLTLTFNLSAKDKSSSVTLTIPDGYPEEGTFKCYDAKGERNLGRASIKRIVHDLVVEFAESAGVPPVPTFASETPAVFDVPAASHDDDATGGTGWTPKGDPSGQRDKLMAVITQYNKTVKGHPPAAVHELATKDILVRCACLFPWLDKQTAKVWGLRSDLPVVVELQIPEPFYLRSRDRPKMRVFQTADKDLSARMITPVSFGLQWMVQKRLERTMTWPIREEDSVDPHAWLPSIVSEITDAVRNCNKTCVICSKPLEFIGLKPAVCSDPLCTFSHMQFGLGEDVIAYMNSHLEVADLLISLTYAATNADASRFNPFPAGVEVTYREEGVPGTNTISFMKGPNVEEDKDAPRVQKAIAALPNVTTMSAFPESKKLQEHLDKTDRLAFPLIRWIITSCRAHLEPVPKGDQFQQMNTPHQYVFVSTPPEVEQRFNAMKAEHGSILAWHGSTFSNWHSILRMGLRNFSGTRFQSHGAAYGAGIYFATDSSTSLGYAQSVSGWDLSMMGKHTFQGLALCEIINFKKDGAEQYKPNPYYVIPEETHVITRFFFAFPDGSSANVAAMDLKKQFEKLLAKSQAGKA